MKIVMVMGVLLMGLVSSGCDRDAPSTSPEPVGSVIASAAASAPRATARLDPARIKQATGIEPEVADGVVKVSQPRGDVKVTVDGWSMPPFMGLTSWAAFTAAKAPGVEAMVMGDLVLFEDEVGDVMRAALGAGLKVTALHNHFFYDEPRAFFMHIEGEGNLDALGKAVRAALDAAKAVRAKSPQRSRGFGGKAPPAASSVDAAKVEAAIGRKGKAKDGMVKVVVGRAATHAACGCEVGKDLGVNTWAAFAGTNDDALVDGDFAVTEDELQPVLKALVEAGIHVVAIHHHMTGEQPRILFLHYWGRGSVDTLGKTLASVIALTKTSP